jgi:hypothetical protein
MPSSQPCPNPLPSLLTNLQAAFSYDSSHLILPDHEGLLTLCQRVFSYNDTIGWISTSIALICMVASGVLLPLMNLVFGKFVTVFNAFNTGEKTPQEFRKDVNHYT